MDWLNNKENNNAGTGLLLAPINVMNTQEEENGEKITRENPANPQELLFKHEKNLTQELLLAHDEHENITDSLANENENLDSDSQDIKSLYQNLANSLESYDPDQFIASSQDLLMLSFLNLYMFVFSFALFYRF